MALTMTAHGVNHTLYTAASVAATGTNSSDTAPSAGFLQCTVQAVWASITGTAVFKLQSSNNGSNWDDIPGATGSTSGTAGSLSIHLSTLPGTAIRLTITSAAGAGTIVPTFAMKR